MKKYDLVLKIRLRRKQKGITQKDASMLIGCNQSQYSKKEIGKQEFTLQEVFTLLDWLNLELECHNRVSGPGIERPFKG